MKSFNQALLAALMLIGASAALAAQSGLSNKRLLAVRTAAPPHIDGHIDDLAWRQAIVVDDLHMIKPNEYDEPSERSEIRLRYDDTAIYIAARFFDTEPHKIIAKSMQQGTLSLSDDLLYWERTFWITARVASKNSLTTRVQRRHRRNPDWKCRPDREQRLPKHLHSWRLEHRLPSPQMRCSLLDRLPTVT